MAFNLTRAAATLTGTTLAKATTATIRRKLVHVPARIASSARRLSLHLPTGWPGEDAWTTLFTGLCAPPTQPRRPDHPAPQGPKRNQWNTTDSEVAGPATPNHQLNSSGAAHHHQQTHRWIEA